MKDVYPRGQMVRHSVAVHVFEYVSTVLTRNEEVAALDPIPMNETASSSGKPPSTNSPFVWRPLDLSEDSAWTKKRLEKLMAVAIGFLEPRPIIKQGMRILRRHRENYDSVGPRPSKLQLIWWEFPEESWDELQEGCSMNFLRNPEAKVTSNADLTEAQIVIAEELVKELVALGVLIKVKPGEMVTNGLLFCLPKPGQPGQWRILSDMRRGGQNSVVGSDPTVFLKSGAILDQLYYGGYFAAVNASKFFYHFPTRPEERKFLGCIHPRTDEHFVYAGLPMEAGNSPAIAGRHGAALLRRVRSSSSLFQGAQVANTWWQHYGGGNAYNPKLSHGMAYIGTDGLPAVLIWAHCDDFLIHGPTHAKTTEALLAFLDMSVDVGMLCHPGKLTPPAQVVKYTGLLFDTTTVPTIRIPEY
jgi:hypothetical protein